ncbi:mechanosensitive ion channel family protein [Babesia ovata]|uniref:Mechanosensitive ion channel family protein n=1 Tax=Babesia ovata TaxID=189622 RepID=A0A2H6KEZ7_9APIC|nr:mechanosensitive ion channel family protein [Babesia ovata]GBE61573.1 mechanosensitive ion channel family protein [Babesia ovata]
MKDPKVKAYMRAESDDAGKETGNSQENDTSEAEKVRPVTPIEYDESDDPMLNTNWCRPLEWLAHEFLHDSTALWIFAVHVSVFFVAICFGPLTLPLRAKFSSSLDSFLSDSMVVESVEAVDMLSDNLSHLQTIRNGLCFLLTTLAAFACTLVGVMSVRYVAIKLLVQPLFYISRLAVVVTYAVDPAAAYCVWTIVNYTLFRKYTVPVYDGTTLLYYRFEIFGETFSKLHEIDLRCYTWANSAFQLLILISMRKLVLSSLLFLFEVSFLPNYSAELRGFLEDQAMLRRFNVAWLNYVNAARESDDPIVIERVERARKAIDKLPMPETPIIHNHQVYYDAKHFTIFRPPIHCWKFRKHNCADMQHKVGELPQFYKKRWIKQCLTNVLTNWSALHYVVHNPSELLFMDYYVPLVSKKTVEEYSQLLFDHIYETMAALDHPDVVRALSGQQRRLLTVKQTTDENVVCTSTLDMPIDRSVSRRTQRFAADPVIAKAQTRPHSMRMASNADDSDVASADESGTDYHRHNSKLRRSGTETDDRRFLTPKMFSQLNPSVVEAFFVAYDIGNCGYVSSEVFTRNVLYMCSLRKRLMSALKNQRSILGLVSRLLSTALWFLIFVVFLMTFRVNKNIVLPSVIGFFSAMIVALSYMYTSFITAIIFVVLSNPYNVGDRIRIDNGEAMYVKAITTYNTEFRCVHEKVITYQNSVLSTMNIINETRARHASTEIVLKVGASTTPAALKQLVENVKSFVNGHPREFVRDGCFVYGSEVQVGHYYMVKVLVTYLDNWACPKYIFKLHNKVIMQLVQQCNVLGITYKRPMAPVQFSGTLNYGCRS